MRSDIDALQHAGDDEPRKGTSNLCEHCKSIETCYIVPGNRQTRRGVNLKGTGKKLAGSHMSAAVG